MLVLSRRLQEKLYFPGIHLIVHVLSVRRGAVRLGIEAPPELTVLREEVQARPVIGQLPGSATDGGGRDVMVHEIDHVLRVSDSSIGSWSFSYASTGTDSSSRRSYARVPRAGARSSNWSISATARR